MPIRAGVFFDMFPFCILYEVREHGNILSRGLASKPKWGNDPVLEYLIWRLKVVYTR